MDALTRALLSGLDHTPAGATGTPVDPLVQGEDPWAALLRAGAAAVYRQAGAQTTVGLTAPALAPTDPRNPVPVDVSGPVERKDAWWLLRLQRTLSEHNARLEAGTLLQLLQVKDAGLRAAVRPLLGPLGLWLADLEPARWSWAHPDPQGWDASALALEEGTIPERQRALQALRAVDPDAARALLVDGFATSPARDRQALLEVWQPVPSDAVFLEHLRENDRSKKVRLQAADLLATLPASGVAERMWARAQTLVLRVKPPLRRARMVVDLPQDPAPADEIADGVPQRKRPGLGPRTSRLAEIVGRVPPHRWTEKWDCTAADLLRGVDPEEGLPLVLGWNDAAVRFGDSDWAGALWRWWDDHPNLAGALHERVRLAPLLPVDLLQAAVLSALRRADTPYELCDAMLHALPTPWPEPVAVAWTAALARHATPDTVSGLLFVSLEHAPRCLDPAHLPPEPPLMAGRRHHKVLHRFNARLSACHALHALLRSPQ
jgi:hypothetical protein